MQPELQSTHAKINERPNPRGMPPPVRRGNGALREPELLRNAPRVDEGHRINVPTHGDETIEVDVWHGPPPHPGGRLWASAGDRPSGGGVASGAGRGCARVRSGGGASGGGAGAG